MYLKTLNDLQTSYSQIEQNEDSVPLSTDSRWIRRIGLFMRAIDEIANDYLLRPLMKLQTFTMTSTVLTLPSDFSKPDALYAWQEPDQSGTSPTGLITITDPYRSQGILLQLMQGLSTGTWTITRTAPLNGTVPSTQNPLTVTLLYYADHPILQNASDLCLIDPELVLSKAAWFDFESSRQWYAASKAQIRFQERITNYVMRQNRPAPGEIKQFISSLQAAGKVDQHSMYSGNTFTNPN